MIARKRSWEKKVAKKSGSINNFYTTKWHTRLAVRY